MKILRTYLLKELLQPTCMALILFTFVMLVGNLVKLADLLVNKGVSPAATFQMFSLLMPTLLSYTVPMAVLTGTLLAFGKLSSDREILAMRASGVSFYAIAAPVLLVGLMISLALVPLNSELVPWTHYATRQVLVNIGIRNPAAFLEAGTFIKEFKPYILFVYQVEGNRLSKIRIYEPKEGYPTRTIVAERGEFIPRPVERRVLLKLYQGAADEPDPKDPSKFYKLVFETYTMNLVLAEGKDPSTLSRKPKDMNLDQLREEEKRLEAQGIDSTPLEIEAQRRTAMSFSPLLFILVGLPLGVTTRRAQRSIGFGMSVVVFLGYYLFLILGQTLSQKGWLPPAPAMWLGNTLLFVTGVILIWRTNRR